MYTVKDNILGKKVCWRLATNQPKNCRKIGKGAYVNKCVPELDGCHRSMNIQSISLVQKNSFCLYFQIESSCVTLCVI